MTRSVFYKLRRVAYEKDIGSTPSEIETARRLVNQARRCTLAPPNRRQVRMTGRDRARIAFGVFRWR